MLSPHGSSSTSSAGQFTSEPSSILTETKDIIIPCDSPETASDTPTHLPCETTLEKECQSSSQKNIEKDIVSLLSSLVAIIDHLNWVSKGNALTRIKLRVAQQKVRRLSKHNFESTNTTNQQLLSSNSSASGYVSISDFAPIISNFNSVKILDYQTHGLAKDVKTIQAKQIQLPLKNIIDKETFLEGWFTKEALYRVSCQEYPMSSYAGKKITAYHDNALAAVRKFSFREYCKLNVRKKSRWLPGKSSDPMQHRKKSLSSSLTHLNDEDIDIAIDIFDCLLRAACQGQHYSTRNYLFQLHQLIQKVLDSNDDIRQQAYLQLIKQLSSGRKIYLQIFSVISACVKPSSRIYIPLLNYLYEEHSLFDNVQHKEYYNCSFYNLIKSFDQPRNCPPTLFEIFCMFHLRQIPIVVCFPKQRTFFVQGHITVQEFIAELIDYYVLDPKVNYLIEINRVVMQKGPLFDQLNRSLPKDQQDYAWHNYQNFKDYQAIIVLKDMTDSLRIPRCHNIMYNYAVQQYLNGMYTLRMSQIIKIAALKMRSEVDNEEQYRFNLKCLISRRKWRNMTEEDCLAYKKHILNTYFECDMQNKVEARREMLRILSKSKGFNTHFFKCSVFLQDYEQTSTWVGLQPNKFIFVDPQTGRISRTVLYNQIRQWGNSKSELCLVIDNLGQLHIDSQQIDVIVSIFQNYLEKSLTT